MSRIARSFCRYTLNFSRNFQTLFKVVAWSCASSHCVEFQVLLGHRHTCFGVVFVCLIVEGLVGGVSGFFIMALICISLITNVAGYLFFFFFLWISYFVFILYLCIFSCVCLPRYFAFGGISFQVIYPVGVRIRCLLCWF